MTWREGGRERVYWVDSSGKLVLRWRPIISEYDDQVVDESDPLDVLTARQRFVVELRYALKDGFFYSQDEVAALMGISQSMVSRHEKAAVERLRKRLIKPPSTQTIGREES